MVDKKRVIICGAAGRDFHNFNAVYRESPDVEVVAFTATQIPQIDDRRYPPSLSGPFAPEGIPIEPEEQLEQLVKQHRVDEVVLAYSDLSYAQVGQLSARVHAAGADFSILGPDATMLEAKVPVVAVCAVRTGCGKSQTSRLLMHALQRDGRRVVAVRHPMPYGNLAEQAVQRFASRADLDQHKCTFEEREEYEKYVDAGLVIYAGVDYHAILEQAQAEANLVLWDGGNNDWPFYRPDVWITLVDPLRAGDETAYFPGEVNLRGAHIVIVPKVSEADPADLTRLLSTIGRVNPEATVVQADSTVSVSDPSLITGRRVLLVDDGPTITHGGMPFGAAQVAADKYAAAAVVDPRPFAVRSIRETFEKYPHIKATLPAMGYFPDQIAALEETINAADCDSVIIGTPFDLGSQLKVNKPCVAVRYELEVRPGQPDLAEAIEARLSTKS